MKYKKKEQASENLAKSKTDIGWGHQIRSYVLQPYQLVKDLRNNLENTDPESVLDGDIDEFLEAALYKTKEKNNYGQIFLKFLGLLIIAM